MDGVDPQVVEPTAERDRKAEHIHLALQDRMQLGAGFFDAYRFEHCALPELDLAAIDTTTRFLGKDLGAPLLISCMTGGTEEARRINCNLAAAAESQRVAIGVGSQRKAIEDPSTRSSFQVREIAPTVPLLANLGAVQLNYGYGPQQCRQAVEMIGADALVLHLNPLQEAIQPEGDVDFSALLAKISAVVEALEVPVIVKEIGMGISGSVGRALAQAGVSIIDTAGLGGTSWARIEAQRALDQDMGELFADWGVPTPKSIRALAQIPGLTVIGSGGVRNGIDMAKAIALGADLVGLAQPFLEAATRSVEAVEGCIARVLRELRICMFCAGAGTLAELSATRLIERTGPE